jgi:hypothetical protein
MKQQTLSAALGVDPAREGKAPARLDPARVAALTREKTASAAEERKVRPMKLSRKRIVVLAAAAVLILALGVTALASSGIITAMSSGSLEDEPFTQLPTEEEAMETAGFRPLLLERFANGYTFSAGYTMDNRMLGENRSVEAEVMSYTFTYRLPEQPDAGSVSFEQIPWHDGETVQFIHGEPAAEIGGVTVYSDGSVLCDQWGNETGDVYRMVSWQQGELQCSLTSLNWPDLDALLAMARELIELG